MGVIGWIVFGFVVGLLARAIFPGRDSMGFLGTTVLGILGAVLAGWSGQALGWYTQDSGVGMLAAVIGAFVVLGIYNALGGRRRRGDMPTRIDRVDHDKGDHNDRYAA